MENFSETMQSNEAFRGLGIAMAKSAADSMRVLAGIIEEIVLPAFRAFYKIGLLDEDIIFTSACEEYRKHHKRLPGSNRTKRLKKKRRKKVLSWYWRMIWDVRARL